MDDKQTELERPNHIDSISMLEVTSKTHNGGVIITFRDGATALLSGETLEQLVEEIGDVEDYSLIDSVPKHLYELAEKHHTAFVIVIEWEEHTIIHKLPLSPKWEETLYLAWYWSNQYPDSYSYPEAIEQEVWLALFGEVERFDSDHPHLWRDKYFKTEIVSNDNEQRNN